MDPGKPLKARHHAMHYLPEFLTLTRMVGEEIARRGRARGASSPPLKAEAHAGRHGGQAKLARLESQAAY